ncbi:unnamed protein product [Ilex paraguariensis]|uniref:Uncharacterized protein n=1 Tax=Ilex paraguariensis TaxID=185542 RepID=A0ABC8U9K5_9AQUA
MADSTNSDLPQSSSAASNDPDLGISVNVEDYVKEGLKIKKQPDQENQGTITKAEFTDQDRNDIVEDTNPILDILGQRMYEFERLARGVKELGNDDDAGEEELKKTLELTSDTKQEYEEEKLKDPDQFNDGIQPDSYTNVEGLEEEVCESIRKLKYDGENEEQGAVNKLNLKRKASDRSDDGLASDDFSEMYFPEFLKRIEEIDGKGEDVMKGELDEKQKTNIVVDEESEALALIRSLIVEFQTDMPRLQEEFFSYTVQKEKLLAKFKQLKSGIAKLKQCNSKMEMEVFDAVKKRFRDLLKETFDRELTDKLNATLNQIEGGEEDSEKTSDNEDILLEMLKCREDIFPIYRRPKERNG